MPFTPFHFGPALLLKGTVPRAFSLATFIAVQVVIDFETLYYLVRQEWPIHRTLHTLVGGTCAGILVAGIGWLVGRIFDARWRRSGLRASALRAEGSFAGTMLGGVLGGASHSVLDGMMHVDVRPYWPFSDSPGALGVVSLGMLHMGCVAAGVLGLGLLWLRSARRPDRGP